MKHILFLTSTNLASNPRCRKEIQLALDKGYNVSVVAFEMENWTKEKEKQITEIMKDVTFYYIPAGRASYGKWLKSVLLESLCRWVYKLGIRTVGSVAVAVNRRTVLMNDLLRRGNIKPDFIIAHNPSAFYPAVKLAQRRKIGYGIDVEDYHPGEGNDYLLQKLNEDLLIRTMPKAAYVTYASEPIMRQVLTLTPQIKAMPHIVVNNSFPASDFDAPAEVIDTEHLQFVWFSQNIDITRGLEQILPVLDNFKNNVRLTLIGNLNKSFYENYLIARSYVTTIPSLSQEELHQRIGQYDIGLAIEPGKDVNNNLALSNKIWTYFQAGLYVLASGTEAQSAFVKRFSDHGVVTSLEESNLKRTITELLEKRNTILANKLARWKYAQDHSWTLESNKLLEVWKQINL